MPIISCKPSWLLNVDGDKNHRHTLYSYQFEIWLSLTAIAELYPEAISGVSVHMCLAHDKGIKFGAFNLELRGKNLFFLTSLLMSEPTR